MAGFFDLTPCPDCRGSGGELVACPFCGGSGRRLAVSGEGAEEICPLCGGKGQRRDCPTCHGMGHLPPALVAEIEQKRREKPGSS